VTELAGERTVILSTHILQEVVQICQKVVIINEGRVVVEDQIGNLTRDMPLEEVFMRSIGSSGTAAEEASA
jgi:ABC-2 type transport system ATP-binding protein